MDIDRDAIRLFKLSRFQGSVEISKKKNEFNIPTDFDVSQHLPKQDVEIIRRAVVDIRKDSGALFRRRGKQTAEGVEFDTYEIDYENERAFLREILWHGENIRLVEPQALKEQLLILIDGILT
jgi:predicted DNA-binding transcriptional regulator YafY